MAVETNEDNEFMPIDPELEAIWNQTEDPSFTQLRNQANTTEQPEDTVDDAEDSDDVLEDDVDDVPEDAGDKPEVEDDNAEVKPEDKVKDSTNAGTHKIRANNMDFEFTTEELEKLAPKALDYTKKMQEIAPWRKTISALKEQGLGEQDVNLMIDVLKGDKNAITEVLKRTGVDALELDTDVKTTYAPNQYGKDETYLAVEELVAQIGKDPEFSITERIVDRDWDAGSRQQLMSNPNMIAGLHADIKNGVYEKVAPLMYKMKSLDGGMRSDIEYYMEAGKQYFMSQSKTPAQAEVAQREKQNDIKEMANRRKAATPSRTGSGKRDVIDYLADDDESFNDWYKNLQAKM